jgi:exodeoxyribonuclease-3
MKIATWNVNGVRAREAQLVEWIGSDRPDILCLQELKASPVQVPAALAGMPDYWSYWHGERAYSGVGLHIRKDVFPAEPQFTHPAFDFEQRIVTARIGDVVVASVYVPNGGKDFAAKMRFLEAMERYVEDSHSTGLKLILCGDINVTRGDQDVHPKERDPEKIGQRPEEREAVERLLSRGLVDVARLLYPDDDAMFTWWPPWRNMRQRNVGWRIDYVLASQALAPCLRQCSVLAAVGTSDHAPVVAVFDYTSEERRHPTPLIS